MAKGFCNIIFLIIISAISDFDVVLNFRSMATMVTICTDLRLCMFYVSLKPRFQAQDCPIFSQKWRRISITIMVSKLCSYSFFLAQFLIPLGTPESVAAVLVPWLKQRGHSVIVDPFCGTGTVGGYLYYF